METSEQDTTTNHKCLSDIWWSSCCFTLIVEENNRKNMQQLRDVQGDWAETFHVHQVLWSEFALQKNSPTLPETNSSPLKIGRNPKGNDRIPTINFQVRALSFGEGKSPLLRRVVTSPFRNQSVTSNSCNFHPTETQRTPPPCIWRPTCPGIHAPTTFSEFKSYQQNISTKTQFTSNLGINLD